MKKIPSVYVRAADDPKTLTETPHPDARWVFDGEGVATRKRDGTAVRILAGALWKRYDCKRGRTPPPGFEACGDPDDVTGHWPGWVPVGDGPEDRVLREVFAATESLADGTYEFCGPKVNGNPERLDGYVFFRHGAEVFETFRTPITKEDLRLFFLVHPVEGIVWHHPDGRMAKIKRRDLGLTWPLPEVPRIPGTTSLPPREHSLAPPVETATGSKATLRELVRPAAGGPTEVELSRLLTRYAPFIADPDPETAKRWLSTIAAGWDEIRTGREKKTPYVVTDAHPLPWRLGEVLGQVVDANGETVLYGNVAGAADLVVEVVNAARVEP